MTGEHELSAKVTPVRRVRPAPKTGLVGAAEIIGLSLSAVLLLAAVVAYFYLVLPARARERAMQNDRVATESSIKMLTASGAETKTASQLVSDLAISLANFEQAGLASRTLGRTELYAQLNELMRQNALRNTAGPIYTALDPLDPNAPAATRTKSGNARFQNFYPGIDVNVTVEGSYAGIRHFVHDVEAMRQFVIINSAELEDVAVNGAKNAPGPVLGPVPVEPKMLHPRGPKEAAPAVPSEPRTPASAVSLRLDMSVYFRRLDTASGANAN